MTIKDIILDEIEMRQEKLSDRNFHSMVDEYDDFASFVDSLPDIPVSKVKYAGKVYNLVGTKQIVDGELMYGIEDEPNHIDYVKASLCEPLFGYGVKDHGKDYPTKVVKFETIEPKFAKGDTIRSKYAHTVRMTIDHIKDGKYYAIMNDKVVWWPVDKQECYELVEKAPTSDTTLEQAAYDYINSDKVKAEHMQQAYGDFIAGAKWYKEHIMKDSIDAWCHWFDNEGGASIVFNGRVAERFNDGQHLKMVLIKD